MSSSAPSVIHVSSQGSSVVLPRGRLVFGIDATASREATWNVARDLQARMFREAAPVGKLDLQLVFYRGGECKASKWCSNGEVLAQLMAKIECEGGVTQIGRILKHALHEHQKSPVQALTFIGDAIEGDSVDELAGLADELGRTGLPVYMFQEGNDATVRKAFRLVALKSGGAYFEFNPDKIDLLAEQLGAVAVCATGGRQALEGMSNAGAIKLLQQLR